VTSFIESYALWLADYYLLSTTLLAGALAASAFVRQPARKLAIVKSSLAVLALLAAHLNREANANNFHFKHVQPLMDTGISRDIDQPDGGMTSVATASVNLLPGESRQIGLGALSVKQREFLEWQQKESGKRLKEVRMNGGTSVMPAPVRVMPVVQRKAAKQNADRPPTLLSYGDGKADGKKSYGGSGHFIRFELPEGVTKVRGLRIHGSRYGYPQAPDEDAEITFLSEDRDETLHTEAAPYRMFKRGKEQWVRVMFDKEVELPKKFWIALNFNAHQTKGVYVSYDTSTKGQYSRVGLPGDEDEPKETDFGGDWMVQVILARTAK
jgi:RNA polymerase sigma-70 factor (ECF subfamily)